MLSSQALLPSVSQRIRKFKLALTPLKESAQAVSHSRVEIQIKTYYISSSSHTRQAGRTSILHQTDSQRLVVGLLPA